MFLFGCVARVFVAKPKVRPEFGARCQISDHSPKIGSIQISSIVHSAIPHENTQIYTIESWNWSCYQKVRRLRRARYFVRRRVRPVSRRVASVQFWFVDLLSHPSADNSLICQTESRIIFLPTNRSSTQHIYREVIAKDNSIHNNQKNPSPQNSDFREIRRVPPLA